MAILVDGDGCPAVQLIKQIAIENNVEMELFCDYSHIVEDEYYIVNYVDVGNDSVDKAIVTKVKSGDIVITQDYGLASYVLAKKAKVLHVSGKEITSDSIDQLLFQRFVSAKQRKAGYRTKHKKRTQQDNMDLQNTLEKMLRECV